MGGHERERARIGLRHHRRIGDKRGTSAVIEDVEIALRILPKQREVGAVGIGVLEAHR